MVLINDRKIYIPGVTGHVISVKRRVTVTMKKMKKRMRKMKKIHRTKRSMFIFSPELQNLMAIQTDLQFTMVRITFYV